MNAEGDTPQREHTADSDTALLSSQPKEVQDAFQRFMERSFLQAQHVQGEAASALLDSRSGRPASLSETGRLGGFSKVQAISSPQFSHMSDLEKWLTMGKWLDNIEGRQDRTERRMKKAEKVAADAQRTYSKYCLHMTGADVPERPKQGYEDPVSIWREVMRAKYNILISEAESKEFRACHRDASGKGLVACFTRCTPGSVFDRCAFRGKRGKLGSNWNGELGKRPDSVNLKIQVERMVAEADRPIKAIGLYIKKIDRNCPEEKQRVAQVGPSKGGYVTFRSGKGEHRRFYHREDAEALLTPEELAEFRSGRAKGRRKGGAKSSAMSNEEEMED